MSSADLGSDDPAIDPESDPGSEAGRERGYGDPETRRRILAATRTLVEREGAGFALSAVATEAGVSRQALYLHFRDRSGLVLALVRDMDASLDLDASLAHVLSATSGAELLERALRLSTEFWRAVAPVARVLIASEDEDPALRDAWRDRMRFRRSAIQTMAERIAELGELDEAWTTGEAADVIFATTHFDAWRELTGQLGWTDDDYVARMGTTLGRALLQP